MLSNCLQMLEVRTDSHYGVVTKAQSESFRHPADNLISIHNFHLSYKPILDTLNGPSCPAHTRQ